MRNKRRCLFKYFADKKRKPKIDRKRKKPKKNKKEDSYSIEYEYNDRPYYPEEGLDLFRLPKFVKLLFSPLKLLGIA